jgi:hypothetical protein
MPCSTNVGAEAAKRSSRGLDGVNFFVAAVQTGFGAFVTVYLVKGQWPPQGDRLRIDRQHDEQPVQPGARRRPHRQHSRQAPPSAVRHRRRRPRGVCCCA